MWQHFVEGKSDETEQVSECRRLFHAMTGSKDSGQLMIDWTAATTPVPVTPAASESPAPPEPTMPSGSFDSPSPVQVLPWNFETHFPPVLPDAVDAGVLTEEDSEPEALAALHAEQGRVLLAALSDLDKTHEARRQSIDPATGQAPRSEKKKQELPEKLSGEIERLERWWQTLLDTYEAGFGIAAVEAFDKFIRARHAGIPIIVQPSYAEPPALAPTLPRPRPLPQSVNAGVFGQDEEGPVNPSEEEVMDITINHAEMIMELMEAFRGASQPDPTNQNLSDQVQEAARKYAEDFGWLAGEKLLTYCHRRVVLNNAQALHHLEHF
jgi:hypothetical protein